MFDVDTDGFVDRVVATFNEALATYTAGTTPWTLANVPSGGSLLSVTVVGTTATLDLTEGTNPALRTTAVGTFTVALAQNANGIRDAAGNQSSFAATAPADKAAPVLIDVTDTDGSINGRFQAGDTIRFDVSEALLASSVPATSNVVLRDPQGDGNNDYLTIPGVLDATLIGTAYLGGQNLTANFTGSAVALSSAGTRITVTLSTCSGDCTSPPLGTSPAVSVTFTLVSTIQGSDGLAIVGSSTKSIALF
jgi:hypothetical protein